MCRVMSGVSGLFYNKKDWGLKKTKIFFFSCIIVIMRGGPIIFYIIKFLLYSGSLISYYLVYFKKTNIK